MWFYPRATVPTVRGILARKQQRICEFPPKIRMKMETEIWNIGRRSTYLYLHLHMDYICLKWKNLGCWNHIVCHFFQDRKLRHFSHWLKHCHSPNQTTTQHQHQTMKVKKCLKLGWFQLCLYPLKLSCCFCCPFTFCCSCCFGYCGCCCVYCFGCCSVIVVVVVVVVVLLLVRVAVVVVAKISFNFNYNLVESWYNINFIFNTRPPTPAGKV